MILGIGIS